MMRLVALLWGWLASTALAGTTAERLYQDLFGATKSKEFLGNQKRELEACMDTDNVMKMDGTPSGYNCATARTLLKTYKNIDGCEKDFFIEQCPRLCGRCVASESAEAPAQPATAGEAGVQPATGGSAEQPAVEPTPVGPAGSTEKGTDETGHSFTITAMGNGQLLDSRNKHYDSVYSNGHRSEEDCLALLKYFAEHANEEVRRGVVGVQLRTGWTCHVRIEKGFKVKEAVPNLPRDSYGGRKWKGSWYGGSGSGEPSKTDGNTKWKSWKIVWAGARGLEAEAGSETAAGTADAAVEPEQPVAPVAAGEDKEGHAFTIAEMGGPGQLKDSNNKYYDGFYSDGHRSVEDCIALLKHFASHENESVRKGVVGVQLRTGWTCHVRVEEGFDPRTVAMPADSQGARKWKGSWQGGNGHGEPAKVDGNTKWQSWKVVWTEGSARRGLESEENGPDDVGSSEAATAPEAIGDSSVAKPGYTIKAMGDGQLKDSKNRYYDGVYSNGHRATEDCIALLRFFADHEDDEVRRNVVGVQLREGWTCHVRIVEGFPISAAVPFLPNDSTGYTKWRGSWYGGNGHGEPAKTDGNTKWKSWKIVWDDKAARGLAACVDTDDLTKMDGTKSGMNCPDAHAMLNARVPDACVFSHFSSQCPKFCHKCGDLQGTPVVDNNVKPVSDTCAAEYTWKLDVAALRTAAQDQAGKPYCSILETEYPAGSKPAKVWTFFDHAACHAVDEDGDINFAWEEYFSFGAGEGNVRLGDDGQAICSDDEPCDGQPVQIRNGPRWALFSIEPMQELFPNGHQALDKKKFTINGQEFEAFSGANIPHIPENRTPYQEVEVQRYVNSLTTFWKGSRVYELVHGDKTYVMQSFTTMVAEMLSQPELETLGDMLTLPEGWKFQTRVLEEDLFLTQVDQKTTIVQDDFKNTYHLKSYQPKSDPRCAKFKGEDQAAEADPVAVATPGFTVVHMGNGQMKSSKNRYYNGFYSSGHRSEEDCIAMLKFFANHPMEVVRQNVVGVQLRRGWTCHVRVNNGFDPRKHVPALAADTRGRTKWGRGFWLGGRGTGEPVKTDNNSRWQSWKIVWDA